MTKLKLSVSLTLSLFAVLVPMTAFGDHEICDPPNGLFQGCKHNITVTLFSDLDNDGVHDPDESVIEGVNLTLFDESDNVIDNIITDSSGQYVSIFANAVHKFTITAIPQGFETSVTCPIVTVFEMPLSDYELDICLVTANLDTVPPVIVLNGESPVQLSIGASYTDAGARVTDDDPNYEGIVTTGGDTVDTATPDTYIITYDASTDAAGNVPLQVTRTVIVLTAEQSIDNISQEINDAIANGDIGHESNALLAKLNQIIDNIGNANINATCKQLDSFIQQIELTISDGTSEEIVALTPLLDAANSIQASYC